MNLHLGVPNLLRKKITSHLTDIKIGVREKLYLGNLSAKRDWGYAKEYVYAMWLMLQNENPDDYVIATGTTTSVRDFVVQSAQELDIDVVWEGTGINEKGVEKKSGRIIVEVASEFYRPAEVDYLIGDASKAKTVLGWQATTSTKELAAIMVKFDYDEAMKRIR